MAAKQEANKNTANNMNCSLCTKLINILKHKPEGETRGPQRFKSNLSEILIP